MKSTIAPLLFLLVAAVASGTPVSPDNGNDNVNQPAVLNTKLGPPMCFCDDDGEFYCCTDAGCTGGSPCYKRNDHLSKPEARV
ncbi:hypothetical protein B0H66DRAFT_637345 [Apodospora peruviana]|uniref:Uncharacterized protein n=1 Tax=Apodospora peruviana TaxID=516989 RepID=A0AAE0MBV3_9PEZI|nr:hypothetical protein B0H66DRAFT_637345 [Apodospora peruviana]